MSNNNIKNIKEVNMKKQFIFTDDKNKNKKRKLSLYQLKFNLPKNNNKKCKKFWPDLIFKEEE